MAGGKFSKPRPHRDEERQIEQAFRQVTGQTPAPKKPMIDEIPVTWKPSQDTLMADPLETDAFVQQNVSQLPPEKPVQDQTPPPQSPKVPPVKRSVPRPERLDLLSKDLEAFFEGGEPISEEPQEEREPDFIDKLMAFWDSLMAPGNKKQNILLLALCAFALVVIVACGALMFASSADPNDGRILDNVIIADIPVGGMTKSEAISAVKAGTDKTFSAQEMVVDLSGTKLLLSPRDTDVKLNVKAAVQEAYDYGRTGTQAEREQAIENARTEAHIIGLLPYLTLNSDYITDTLSAYATDVGSTLTQPTYGLEGREPELSADKFDEKAPTQTLVITLGTPGIGFDAEEVYDLILDAYSMNEFLVTVEDVEAAKEPEELDLRAIYQEYYIEPVNASVNLQTFETVPGSYGYGFDLEATMKLLEAADYGETLRIPMEYIAPEVLDGDAFFRDVLGSHKTRHTTNDNRNTNLKLACEAIDGTVLDPGETFSFNETVGQRTSARGYKVAPADASISGETTLGGGISQVSSTLYYAATLADLEIVSRRANKFAPNFIDYGMDAAVSWNMYDFSFRNNLGYPIRISAKVTGGYVKIEILGTEERDYYVILEYAITKTTDPKTETKEFPFNNPESYKDGDVIQEGVTGYTVKTYKRRYDRFNDEEISKDYLHTTDYLAVNKIIAKVEPEETTAPTTVPTTIPTLPTTQPATTAPAESTQPSTTEATQPTPETTQPTPEATQPTPEPPATTESEFSNVINVNKSDTPASE